MSSSHHQQPSGRDFEDKDIRLRPILLFFFWTALFTAGVFFAIHYFQVKMETGVANQDAPISTFATEPVQFPEPRLQVNEQLTLAQQREREAAQLHRYAWVDQAAGVVQIPIDRAMELVVERGLPARQPAESK